MAVALGRPVHINTDDSDVEMICEDDFIEDDINEPSDPPDLAHVHFFLQYVKLCEIMGLVLSQQYSVTPRAGRQNAIDLTHSDMALADWLRNCPKEIYWEPTRHDFWSALLHSNYYTTLCLLHRAHMPSATTAKVQVEDGVYPSRHIAQQAAAMLTSIIENLVAHDELRYCPAFVVYSLFSAMIMHVYQMRSSSSSVVQTTQERIRICMSSLKDISNVWLVAKMVYALFESILGNKTLEERLYKAAGNRHKKMTQALNQGLNNIKNEPHKRKYDDMALDFTVNTAPAHQESYERSRPQTPSRNLSSGDLQSAQAQSSASMPAPPPPQPTSPTARANADTFMGHTTSRPQTRPQTPFNPSYSVPATPPDLYLVTRNSPNLSQSVWENFQPDQLFPEGSSAGIPMQNASPVNSHTAAGTNPNLDPSLVGSGPQQGQQNRASLSPSQQQTSQTIPLQQRGRAPPANTATSPIQSLASAAQQGLANYNLQQQQAQQGLWASVTGNTSGNNLDPGQETSSAVSQCSETWSNGSGQAVPTTLNVDDWCVSPQSRCFFSLLLRSSWHSSPANLPRRFQFFGLNGDISALAGIDATMV